MSTFTLNRPKAALSGEPTSQSVASVGTLPELVFTLDAPAPVASLRETMAAVISAVDALERREMAGRNSVDLQFHIGDERLALRVELRDGAVHTTFRTDSSDLRAALSQEWQSVVQPVNQRDSRLADPIFSSTLSGGADAGSSSLGQGAPHQRGQAMPQQTAARSDREFHGSAVAEPVAPTAPTTSLLNAFA